MNVDWGPVISLLSGVIIVLLGVVIKSHNKFEDMATRQFAEIKSELKNTVKIDSYIRERDECRQFIVTRIDKLDDRITCEAGKSLKAREKIWDALHKHRHDMDGAIVRGD